MNRLAVFDCDGTLVDSGAPIYAALSQNFAKNGFEVPSAEVSRKVIGLSLVEAMAAGCGLVISDRTSWNDIEIDGIGWELSLDNKDIWREQLKYCINLNQAEFAKVSRAARDHAMKWLGDPSLEAATSALFEHALSKDNNE